MNEKCYWCDNEAGESLFEGKYGRLFCSPNCEKGSVEQDNHDENIQQEIDTARSEAV